MIANFRRVVVLLSWWLLMALAVSCQSGGRVWLMDAEAPTASAQPVGVDANGAGSYKRGLVGGLAMEPSADDSVDGLMAAFTDAAGRRAAERMLIHRGEVQVEVPRADEAMAAFLAKVVLWGGYLAAQQSNRITVRVPAATFKEAFEFLQGMGRVLASQQQADDVTEEFFDLGIRLENARRSRGRLLELLEKATEVEAILKIETELHRLTEEIERMEGRQRFLADQVAMATLVGDFRSVAEPPPTQPGSRPSRFHWIRAIGPERVMGGF